MGGRRLGRHDDGGGLEGASVLEPDFVGVDAGDSVAEHERVVVEAGRELAGNLAHASSGHRGASRREHAKDEAEEAGGRGEVGLEEHAAEKGAEEASDEPVGEPARPQVRERGLIVGLEGVVVCAPEHLAAKPEYLHFVAYGGGPSEQRREDRTQVTRGVPDRFEPLAIPEDSTGLERPQVEGVHVELTLRFGVAGEDGLKPTVEQETVDLIRLHPTADGGGTLDDAGLDALGVQGPRTRKAGQPSANDDDRFHHEAGLAAALRNAR
jgi:hypothetical protein